MQEQDVRAYRGGSARRGKARLAGADRPVGHGSGLTSALSVRRAGEASQEAAHTGMPTAQTKAGTGRYALIWRAESPGVFHRFTPSWRDVIDDLFTPGRARTSPTGNRGCLIAFSAGSRRPARSCSWL